MPVTPNVVNFTYKKYGVIPPGVLIDYEAFHPVTPPANIYTYPSYILPNGNDELIFVNRTAGSLNYINIYDVTATAFKIKVGSVDALAAGSHTFIYDIYFYNYSPDEFNIAGTITVNLTIEDTIILSLNPVVANFNFEIGGTAPVNKIINVTSENNWTVSKNAAWLTLSATSGSNSGTFQIGVITTALAAGVYNDTVTVNDGVTSKTVAVSLTVTNPNTGVDYLYVLPNILNFNFSVNGATPPSKYIEINPSGSWTATKNQTWLNLPVTSGTAGPKVVEVALQNLGSLAVGQYIGEVKFTVGNINKTVVIELNVYNFTPGLLTDTELYYSEENNLISIASGRLDTFMRLSISSLYKSVSYFIEASLPIFKGGASKRIGIEPHKIIGAQPLIGLADASVSPPYPPIKLNIIIDEIELFTGVVSNTQSISNITFIKGKKPSGNWLSELPNKVFLTPKATLCFGVLSGGVTPTSIEITGDIVKSINVSTTASAFYNVVLPLSAVGSLNEGDRFNVYILGQTITVVVRKEQVDHSMIYWENNNGVWDSCELIGEVNITSDFERKTATLQKTELTTETKVIDVTVPVSYKINTGFVHTKEEVVMLNKMLQSKNIYLQTQGKITQVYPQTRKLDTTETLRETTDFDLVFNNTIE